MQLPEIDSPEAQARVIAMMMVADTEVAAEELRTLDEVDAFGRLGISRTQFMRAASRYCAELKGMMGSDGWLRLSDVRLIDSVLSGVRDPVKRLLVARIAAAVVVADKRVLEIERLVFDHMLARWGLTLREVSVAIRGQPLAAAA